jgi:hypothetical protein
MVTPKAQEQLIRVAVEVLQTQDSRSVSILKNFLAFDPNPTATREILSTAVTELVDTAPAAVCWLLQYPEHLRPEVNVSYLVSQKLLQRLMTLGFSQGQSFILEDDRIFEVSETAKAALLTHSQSFEIQSPLEVVKYFESN